MCVYLLLPWDLHSKQGLLFNGTIIKCAVSKHWWFALSPVYSPIRLIPRAAPFPHSAAFLDVNTSKSLAAKHWLKHSWENRNILLVMCGTLFSPPKIPSSACQVQKGSRGPHQLDVLSFRLQNTIISTCSFFSFHPCHLLTWSDFFTKSENTHISNQSQLSPPNRSFSTLCGHAGFQSPFLARQVCNPSGLIQLQSCQSPQISSPQ